MHRIEDYYRWNKLRQWKFVIETGNVGWKKAGNRHVENDVLERALQLLINNCFPTAIICLCTREHKKEILTTPLWEDIFSFVNNERQIIKDGREIWFRDMKPEDQRAVLGATIFSIWIRD